MSLWQCGKHEIVKWVVQTINSHMNEGMKVLSGEQRDWCF